jgi:type VI secretion system secreted protein VgrG
MLEMELEDFLRAGAGLTDAGRPIRLRLAHGKRMLSDVLLVARAAGTEAICGGLEYRLSCVSTDANLPLKDFIAVPAELQLVTDRGRLRSVCGIVAEAAAGPADGGLATYHLVVRDALAIMELRSNTRVFRNLDEVRITRLILDEWRNSNPVLARSFDFDLSRLLRSYPAREFTMQHNESDADFLRRLWKRRGLAWAIRPGRADASGSDAGPAHTLVLFDDVWTLPQNAAGCVRYHRDDATEKRDTITAWSPVRTLRPGSVARYSWDYAQARLMTGHDNARADQGPLGNEFAANLDDFLLDMPHAGDDADDYRRLGTLRMLRHEYESKCFHGESSVRDLCIGEWIGVAGHPEIDTHSADEREFVITELAVDTENNLPKTIDDRAQRLFAAARWTDAAGGASPEKHPNEERAQRYSNRFVCVRRGIPIVPAFDTRTDLPSPRLQSAIVVGPPGEEIYCDEHGRIKVRFPGCRPQDHAHAQGAGASNSERDSAWIRVASTWAGAHRGAITLPRIGDEVIVDFMGGDPDKPVVIGSVYNGAAAPPAFSHAGKLPGNKYLAGIKSKEVSGFRYNQLRLDDTPGQINAQLASQHGHSELNLGWLTHPRHDGKGQPRGEGAELRSDNAVAVRGGQGVLISADVRVNAQGKLLDRGELVGLTELLRSVQQQLSKLSEAHSAGPTDLANLNQLAGRLKHWEQGSNTEAGTPDAGGGQPIIAASAPGGMVLASQDNLVLGAQTEVDIVSVGNTQISSGRKLLMRAAQSISLFVHGLGMKLIAAAGKIEIQTHQDDIEVTSARRIVLTAAEEIVLQAPNIRVIAQGAQVDLGHGAITQQSSGAHIVKSATFAHLGPGGGSPPKVDFPGSVLKTDEKFVVRYTGSNAPVKNAAYRIFLNNGKVVAGRTDVNGETELAKDQEMLIAQIEIEDMST